MGEQEREERPLRRKVSAALLMLGLLLTLAPPVVQAVLVDPVVVTGNVVGGDAVPVEGAVVELVGLEDYNTTTDADGNYTLVIPYNEAGHTIRFRQADRVTQELSTGTLTPNGHVVLDVTLLGKAPRAVLLVTIEPYYGTYGLRRDDVFISNATGTPFFNLSEDAPVQVNEYAVPAPGTYHVTGFRPGYYTRTLTVTVERGDRLELEIDLTDLKKPTYGTVVGLVEFEGVGVVGASVVAEPEEGDRDFEAVTDTDGRYQLQLPNGTYRVYVDAEGYARLSEGVDVELGKDSTIDFQLTEAQETGEEGNPILLWSAVSAIVVVLIVIIVMAVVTSRRTARARAEAEAAAEMLVCLECDAEVSKEDDRCPACGSLFPWRSFRCPDCGASMEMDAQRCPECGNQTFDLHGG